MDREGALLRLVEDEDAPIMPRVRALEKKCRIRPWLCCADCLSCRKRRAKNPFLASCAQSQPTPTSA